MERFGAVVEAVQRMRIRLEAVAVLVTILALAAQLTRHFQRASERRALQKLEA